MCVIGYGGVLACGDVCATVEGKGKVKSNTSSKLKKEKMAAVIEDDSSVRRWRVEVMCEGVGGFAVGVARKTTAYPFKSLGNRGDAWVLHSSGHLLYNRSQTLLGRCRGHGKGDHEVDSNEYGEGDVIEVHVRAGGELGFTINNEPLECGVVLPPGEYVLCCQPYMGGGARLLC